MRCSLKLTTVPDHQGGRNQQLTGSRLKPSKLLLDQAAWEGSAAIAVQTYEKDTDGFVTKVNKVYDGGEPEIYEYVWEKL